MKPTVNAMQRQVPLFWIVGFVTIGILWGDGTPGYAMQDRGLESAKLVPSDADLYSVALRIPEQWSRFARGPVVNKLIELPFIENAIEQFRFEWAEREGLGATVRTAMENPNSKEALAFVRELISGEVFILGDRNVSQWYRGQAKLNDDMREMAIDPDVTEVDRAIAIMNNVIKIIDDLTVPTLLVGAKCNDVDLALGKIDQLEAVIQLGMSSLPNGSLIFKNFSRIDDARGDRLQLRLEGKQIPWEEFPVQDVFGEEVVEEFREVFEKKSILITVGMFDGFFVVGISPTAAALLELGKGKTLLDLPDLQVVKDVSTKPLTYVGYTSDALSKATFESNLNNFFSRNITTLIAPVLASVASADELRDFSKKVLEDCKWMDESIAKFVPEFKGATSFSFLTEDGWERHDYLRTQNALAESVSALGLLNHVGADPLLFVATKLQDRPEYFQLSRKIVQRFKTRMDEAYALDWSEWGGSEVLFNIMGPMLAKVFPDQNWNQILDAENAKGALELGWPYLVRVADTWEKKFLPAMTGEHAIVVTSGNLSAKQWHKEMPPSVEPLGLPEVASLCGIKDRAAMDSAFEELFKICQDLLGAVRTQNPGWIPDGYQIPRPKKSQSKLGESFRYHLPPDFPAANSVVPQMLFLDKWMIESYSNKQSESLAEVKKLEKGQGVIDPAANYSSASYANVGRMFELARPWIRYALNELMESMDDTLFDGTLPDNYELTGKDLLSAWNILCKVGEFSSVTTSTPMGGSHVRSVYRSQRAQ